MVLVFDGAGEVRGMRHTAYYCCFLIVVAANLYVAGIL